MSENTSASAKTETKTSTESKSSDKSESSTPKKSSPPAREISYFSSVSSNDYRAGWEGIFKKNNGKKKSSAPTVVELTDADLNKGLRTQLEKALRKKSEKEGIKITKSKMLTWRIECDIL